MYVIRNGIVTGPSSSTDNAVARFDGSTGKIIQNSVVTISDAGIVSGATQINVDNLRLDGNTISSTDLNGNVVIDTVTAGTGTLVLNDQIFPAEKPGVVFDYYLAIDPSTGIMSWETFPANPVVTLDIAYESGSLITLSASSGGIQIRDTASGIGGNLLEIENNAGSTQYFAVTASGFSGTRMDVDNIRIDGSTISNTVTDDSIVITPNGTGVVVIGSSSSSPDDDMRLNRLGIGGSTISANAIVTGIVTSSVARTVLDFQLTYTGAQTAIIGGGFLVRDESTGTGAQNNLALNPVVVIATATHTGTTQNIAVNANLGVADTIDLTGGTHNMIGMRVQFDQGQGAGASTGTVRSYGVRIESIPNITGTTQTKWGVATAEDIALTSNTRLYMEGTLNAKGDSYTVFNSSTTDWDFFVDNTKCLTLDNDFINTDLDFRLTTAGGGFYVKEGTNATMGTATLVAGTVTVNTTKVTANSRIFLTNNANGGTVGALYVSARTAGTSFTITSTNGADTSTIAWIIMEPA